MFGDYQAVPRQASNGPRLVKGSRGEERGWDLRDPPNLLSHPFLPQLCIFGILELIVLCCFTFSYTLHIPNFKTVLVSYWNVISALNIRSFVFEMCYVPIITRMCILSYFSGSMDGSTLIHLCCLSRRAHLLSFWARVKGEVSVGVMEGTLALLEAKAGAQVLIGPLTFQLSDFGQASTSISVTWR